MIDGFLGFSWLIDMLDIIFVAVVLYWVMLLVRRTKAERMLWGLGVLVIISFASGRMELLTLHWLLTNFLASIAIFIIVVFQQDIRRALSEMGRPFMSKDSSISVEFLDKILSAVDYMSRRKIGALIVMERTVDLKNIVSTGVNINGDVSKELLLTIFNPGSPLHDGAVIIKGGKISTAGAILPLAEKEMEKSSGGTRHRAALGLSEETDAVIIVVSEETGEVSIVVEEVEEHVGLQELETKLKEKIGRRK